MIAKYLADEAVKSGFLASASIIAVNRSQFGEKSN